MAYLKVKIVAVEGDSVLIKYATENSKKSIDDYPAVAYQPALLGYTDIDSFLEGVRPGMLAAAEARDRAEADVKLDFSSWVGNDKVFDVAPQPDPALPTQTLPHLTNPEVKI